MRRWTINWQGKQRQSRARGHLHPLRDPRHRIIGPDAGNLFRRRPGRRRAPGIVVIGERPYAEMQGDSVDLSLPEETASFLANMKKAGIPLVVVLLSGRPVILGAVLDQAVRWWPLGCRGPKARAWRTCSSATTGRPGSYPVLGRAPSATSHQRRRQGLRSTVPLRVRLELLNGGPRQPLQV